MIKLMELADALTHSHGGVSCKASAALKLAADKIEEQAKEIAELQVDSDCFNFWVHEAWNNPGDMARLLSSCETADDYRAKIIPLMELRKAAIDAARSKT